MLTRLVEDKDVVTLENIDKVRLLFQSNLTDEDTYIYLSSIFGLVAVARYRPDHTGEPDQRVLEDEDEEIKTI